MTFIPKNEWKLQPKKFWLFRTIRPAQRIKTRTFTNIPHSARAVCYSARDVCHLTRGLCHLTRGLCQPTWGLCTFDKRTLSTDKGALSTDMRTLSTDMRTLSFDMKALSTDMKALSTDKGALSFDMRALSFDMRALTLDKSGLSTIIFYWLPLSKYAINIISHGFQGFDWRLCCTELLSNDKRFLKFRLCSVIEQSLLNCSFEKVFLPYIWSEIKNNPCE